MTNIPSQILENLHYFLTGILPLAYSNEEWDLEEVEKAYKWANYCKKVFSNLQLCDSKLQEKCINSLQPLVTPMPAEEILAVLQNPISALNKALLQNLVASDEVFEQILAVNTSVETVKDDLLEDMQKVASSRAVAVHLMTSLLEYGCETLRSDIEDLHGA